MRKSRGYLVAWTVAAAGVPAVAGEGGGGMGKALITPEIGTLFWTVVTFLAMVFLLGKFAWKPLLAAIDDREQSIRESIEQARRNREESAELLEQHQQLVVEAHRERSEALAVGQQEAERVKEELMTEARRQRDQLMQQTAAQVEAAMQQARGELRDVAAELVIQAAEKLLSERLDDATHRRLVEDYIDDLERGRASGSAPS